MLAARVTGLFTSATVKAEVAAKPLTAATKPVTKQKASLAPSNRPVPATTPAARFTDSANPYQPPKIFQPPDAAVKRRVGGRHELTDAFRTIWFRPRVTIRWLIDERDPREAILLISIVFGLKYLDNVISGDGPIAFGMLLALIAIPISALIGIFFLYAAGLFYRLIGQALGGEGDGPEIRTAFAWSFVPTMAAFPLTVVLFTALNIWPSFTMNTPLWIINFPFLALGIWGIVIQIAGLSVAHQFSIPRAIGTFLLTFALVILVMWIVFVGGGMIISNAYS